MRKPGIIRSVLTITLVTVAASLAAQQTTPATPSKEAGDDKSGYTDTPQLPGQTWKVHDAARPRPPKVTPGLPLFNEPPPSDAVVLFNGKDLSAWTAMLRGGKTQDPQRKVENG